MGTLRRSAKGMMHLDLQSKYFKIPNTKSQRNLVINLKSVFWKTDTQVYLELGLMYRLT
jgi:hypothetical protein